MITQSASTSLRMSRGTLALARSYRTAIARATPKRYFSSETPPPPSQGSRVPLVLAAAVASGVLGYAVSKSLSSKEKAGVKTSTGYGSPQDFQKAIKDLRDAFDDPEAVSTDADDLRTHGFSTNDWHPGMSSTRNYMLFVHRLTMPQRNSTVLSSTPTARRMSSKSSKSPINTRCRSFRTRELRAWKDIFVGCATRDLVLFVLLTPSAAFNWRDMYRHEQDG